MMQLLNRIIVTSLFLMITLILVMPVWADVWIDNFYCDPDSFEWWRDGQKQDSDDLVPYLILQSGDKIKVIKSEFNEQECFMTLRKSEDDLGITLTQNSTSIDGYLIKNHNTSLNFLKNILGKKGNKFLENMAELFKEYWTYDNQMKQCYVKAPPKEREPLKLKIPLLEGDDAQLKASERILHLGWDGGTPPYHIRVSHKKTQKLFLNEPNINEETVTSEKQDWIEGGYQVTVNDDAENTVTQEFTVVNQVEALSSKDVKEIKLSNLPEETIKPTLLAIWLVKENNKWRFEAYQFVAPIDEEYYPAFLIKQGLKDIGQ